MKINELKKIVGIASVGYVLLNPSLENIVHSAEVGLKPENQVVAMGGKIARQERDSKKMENV